MGRIVFIGAGAVGLTAAFIVARKNPDAQITLFSTDDTVAYSQCGMPFVLEGKIEGFDKLVLYKSTVYQDLGLDLRTSTAVTSIDVENKTVTSEKGDVVEYEKLVIATGSTPFKPPIPGIKLQGVHTLHTLQDGKDLGKALETAKSVVIIGGGPIGLEAAPGILKKGIAVTIVERMPQLMPSALDPDMTKQLEDYVKSIGAVIVTGKGVDSINGTDQVESVTVGGERFKADLVLLSAGVKPNVDLARKTGIDIGPAGGIDIDDQFRVSIKGVRMDDVLAAGDCAEVINAVTGAHAIYAVAVVANRQGRYIAEHLLGNKIPYGPVICPTVTVIGDLQVGSVGLTTRACEMAGITPVSHKAKSFTKARYYPGGKPIDVKLISDGEYIVGGQVIGEEDVSGRINLLAMGIHKKITVHELADAETCYAPPVAPVIDPLTYTAETLELKCKRLKIKKQENS